MPTKTKQIETSNAELLVTSDEIVKRLRISRQLFALMVTRGEFPPGVRIGRRLRRWRQGDVDAWSEAGGCGSEG